MKKHTLTLAAAMMLLAFAACKKSKNDSQGNMVGTWKLHEQVIDSNNNGKIDSSDPVYNDDSLNINILFKSDGTGGLLGFGPIQAFSWKLINGNTAIQLTYVGGPTDYPFISQSATSITIEDTTQSPIVFQTFIKQ